MIWSVVEISRFRQLCSGFGLSLSLEPGTKVDFDFVVEKQVMNTIGNPLRSPCPNFVQDMEPVAVPKHFKDDLDAPMEAGVHSQFRGGVGQLQWLQSQGSPLLSFATGILQSKSATPKGHDLLTLNKLMREAKSMPDLCWWTVSVSPSFVWLTAADAAWANRPGGPSTSGHVIMAAHPNILRGESSTVSVLAWNARRVRRVVRSSLGAECAAFSTGLEHADVFRVLYGGLCGDLCDLAEYDNYLQATEASCVNDCRSLADALLAASAAASKTSEDKHLGIDLTPRARNELTSSFSGSCCTLPDIRFGLPPRCWRKDSS